jgi:ankyrin repeat protein
MSNEANRLIELACEHGAPASAERLEALGLLSKDPSLGKLSLATAVITDDLERVRELLAEDAGSANRKLGPKGWEPLLYLCWARLGDTESALEIAKALLAAGANPNAHFVDEWGSVNTAITGLLGSGEQGPHPWPPHAHAESMARLLLEHGAEPNQSQALYNTMFQRSDQWLTLFLEHGLSTEHWPNWTQEKKANMLDFLLGWAVKNDRKKRVELLLAHGANPNANDFYNGKKLHENAQLAGDEDMAALLVRHGATPVPLTGLDRYTAAILRGDATAAKELVLAHPEYLDNDDVVNEAARRGLAPSVSLLLSLGKASFRSAPQSPLHTAAYYGHLEVMRLLLDAGVDPSARDASYGSTPLGHALFAGRTEAAELLAERTTDVFDVIRMGRLDRLATLLDEDPQRISATTRAGSSVLHFLPSDAAKAGPIAKLLLGRGADPNAKDGEGRTPAAHFQELGQGDIAKLISP